MTVEYTFNANQTLASLSDDIIINSSPGSISVQPSEKHVHPDQKPRLVWKSANEFMLNFHKMGNSPVGNGKYVFQSKWQQNEWRVVIMVKDVVYQTKLKYDVTTAHGTLDPALIIDPN